MNEETKRVLNGEYDNPKLETLMDDALQVAIVTLDLSWYMKLRKLRTNVITDDYFETEYVNQEDNGLSL